MVASGAALIYGGGALGTSLAGPMTAGVLSLLGAGAAGGAGYAMCMGPLYCRTRRGQCCLISFESVSTCPQSC